MFYPPGVNHTDQSALSVTLWPLGELAWPPPPRPRPAGLPAQLSLPQTQLAPDTPGPVLPRPQPPALCTPLHWELCLAPHNPVLLPQLFVHSRCSKCCALSKHDRVGASQGPPCVPPQGYASPCRLVLLRDPCPASLPGSVSSQHHSTQHQVQAHVQPSGGLPLAQGAARRSSACPAPQGG